MADFMHPRGLVLQSALWDTLRRKTSLGNIDSPSTFSDNFRKSPSPVALSWVRC